MYGAALGIIDNVSTCGRRQLPRCGRHRPLRVAMDALDLEMWRRWGVAYINAMSRGLERGLISRSRGVENANRSVQAIAVRRSNIVRFRKESAGGPLAILDLSRMSPPKPTTTHPIPSPIY